MSNKKTRVLIVGGGFGGVKAAVELAKCGDCNVTLLSDHSHFRYYPSLYHAATGGKRSGSSIRLSNILKDTGVKFVRGTATKLDRETKHIATKEGDKLPYDILILALGSVTNYFGIKGLEKYSYGIKSIEQAEEFRTHLHQQLAEQACPDLNYIVVGGGPTGIELAGALPGYLRKIMKKHGVKECKLNIELIEAAPKLLPRSHPKVSQAVAHRLRRLGVKLYTGKTVEGETADMLMVAGKPLKTHTVVWTAGVTNHPFFKTNNFALNERGKVHVDEHLQAEPNIYVIGDNADTPFSGLAQIAVRDGHFVASNIQRQLRGHAPKPYNPHKPITVIPVGPNWAATEWGSKHFTGWAGWMLRMAADLIAFHDLETWPKAGEQWVRTMSDEETCPICAKK